MQKFYIFLKNGLKIKKMKNLIKIFSLKSMKRYESSSNNHFDQISLFKILKIRSFTIAIGEKVAENRVKLFSVKVF